MFTEADCAPVNRDCEKGCETARVMSRVKVFAEPRRAKSRRSKVQTDVTVHPGVKFCMETQFCVTVIVCEKILSELLAVQITGTRPLRIEHVP